MERNLNYSHHIIGLPIHKILTEREIQRVIRTTHLAREKAVKTGRKTPVIEWLIVNTSLWGLRVSESRFLECGQIHPEYMQLTRTKGGKPRNVLIDPVFSRILQQHLRWKASIGEPTGPRDPLFYSHRTSDHRYTRQGLAKAFRRAIRRAKIDKPLSPHCGRHTLASHNPPQFAQPMLGHSHRETTELYSHVVEAQKIARQYGKKLYSGINEKGDDE